MLRRSTACTLALVGGLILGSGCHLPQTQGTAGHPPAAADSRPEQKHSAKQPSEKDLTDAYAHYMMGVIDELGDKPGRALQEYYQATLKDPASESLVLAVSARLIGSGQSDKALEVLKRAAEQPGASGAVYARLGILYSRLDKTQLSIEAGQRAIKLDPRLLTGYASLFVNYLQNHDHKKALSVLDEAAAVPETTPDFLIGLAGLYVDYGLQVHAEKASATTRARALLEHAAKLGIDDPHLRLRLAEGFELAGQEDRAAAVYKSMIAGLGDEPVLRDEIRAKLVNLYLQGNHRKLAAEELQALVRDDPTDAEAYYWLGRIAADEQDYGTAVDNFSKTVLLRPAFEPGYYQLARAQIGANRNHHAIETLRKARRRFPQSFALEYLSAVAYTREKDYTNAWNHFNTAEMLAQARDTNRLTAEFYFEFGAVSERRGDYTEAEKYFRRSLRLSPNSAETLNYLGFMWADHDTNLNQARELIRKALKLEPRNAAYLDSMGWVLFKLHQPKEALDYVLDAVHTSKEPDPALYDHLGDIYSTLGDKDKALQAWKKSLVLEPNDTVRKKIQSAGK